LVLAWLACSGRQAAGQASIRDGHESGEPIWREAGADANYRIELHQRTRENPHSGNWCEHLRLASGRGSRIHFFYGFAPAHVIDELAPSVWVRSDRRGIRLAARIVFPRVRDPQSGVPATMLVEGDLYERVGHWQRLSIREIGKQIEQKARFLRPIPRSSEELREAYLDRLVLNAYAGEGPVDLWIDDLVVAGYVSRNSVATPKTPSTPAERPSAPIPANESPPERSSLAVPAPTVKVEANQVVVNGTPFFAQMIMHHGEPLGRLKQWGFNAVRLDEAPEPQLLQEARRQGLWLVCPPPRPAGLEQDGQPIAELAAFGPEYDCVLAWDLGRGLVQRDVEPTRVWAEKVRQADRRMTRPLTCEADSELRAFSRIVDILTLDRSPLGTSLELNDYGIWLRQRPRLAKPGMPIWTTIHTAWPLATQQQQAVRVGQQTVRIMPGSEQVRLLMHVAISSNARGVCFETDQALVGGSPESRYLASLLELLNIEMALIAPWGAAGQSLALVDSSQPEAKGAVLKMGRSQLLLPVWTSPGAQYVPAQSAGNDVTYIVPGIPESSRAYEITPGGMRMLWDRRVTGGMRIQLEEFGLTSLVLLTDDGSLVLQLRQRLSQMAQRTATLQRQLALTKLQRVEEVNRRLAVGGRSLAEAEKWIGEARAAMQQCDQFLAAAQYRDAYLQARRTMRTLRLLEQAHWDATVSKTSRGPTTPFEVGFGTLPEHWELITAVRTAASSPNLLAGGDFEGWTRLQRAGWSHVQHHQIGVVSSANLTPEAQHGGGLGLRLRAQAQDPQAPPALVENPPVWIASPAVEVRSGQLIRIHGWVNVPEPISGSLDGLMILDSLTGAALAKRYGATSGWQEVEMIRLAPESGSISVTIALTGLGEALIDDFEITTLTPRLGPPNAANVGRAPLDAGLIPVGQQNPPRVAPTPIGLGRRLPR
jgi:hypothetical protein